MTEIFPIIPASGKPLWFLGGLVLFLTALSVFFGYIAYSTQHVRFEILPDGLRIRGDIYGRLVPGQALKLAEARAVDLVMESGLQPKWKRNGIGLPGYLSGWFRLRNGEKALLFLTDRRRVVYIPTDRGYVILVSVAEPPVFLEMMRQIIISAPPGGGIRL